MADNKEIGRIGQRRYGGVIYEEFLHELRGKRGIEAYREMSENDDVVGAILFAIEMLVRQTDWNVEPGGDSQADIDAAEFVESCMNDMQNTYMTKQDTALRSGRIGAENKTCRSMRRKREPPSVTWKCNSNFLYRN